MTGTASRTPAPARGRRPGSTAAGLLVLGVMLFPLYWMLNTALRPEPN